MLTIIQVGHDDASDRYIRNKVKAVEKADMKAEIINLQENCTTDDILDVLDELYWKPECRAIIVQLPLPKHIDKNAVMKAIPKFKDIDGLNPYSVYKPLTPCAIMRWLDEQGVNLEGKNVAILGRSELVGKPLANMMIDAGATVTVMNSKTDNFTSWGICDMADIIVSAVGKVDTIGWNHISSRHEQIIIDVGINRDANGKLCGDVSAKAKDLIESCEHICTPVPGGVGKWTVRELVLRLKEMEGLNG